MPRVKGGYVARRRRKKVLKLAKGYYGSKHAIYRTAHEQVMRALQFSYRDRKVRKREFRKLWIVRINAACQLNGIKYNQFINGLKNAGLLVNRKMLADLAVNDAATFTSLVETAKKGLAAKPEVNKVEYVFVKPAKKEERSKNHADLVANTKKEVKVEAKKEVKAEPKKEVKVETKKETKTVDYASMNLTELKALCKERGLKGYSTLKKDEIIALLSK